MRRRCAGVSARTNRWCREVSAGGVGRPSQSWMVPSIVSRRQGVGRLKNYRSPLRRQKPGTNCFLGVWASGPGVDLSLFSAALTTENRDKARKFRRLRTATGRTGDVEIRTVICSTNAIESLMVCNSLALDVRAQLAAGLGEIMQPTGAWPPSRRRGGGHGRRIGREFRDFMRGRWSAMVRLAYTLTGDQGHAKNIAPAAYPVPTRPGGGWGGPATRTRTCGPS